MRKFCFNTGDFLENFNAFKYINSLSNFKFPASLKRVKRVMERFNNPQNSFCAVHIAGTNGKGSAVSMIASSLEFSYKKVGKFISPHIVDFRERIQINGEFISETDLNNYGERIKNTGTQLNKFEFITCLAFLYFAEKKVDIAVIETGLGGKLDATNVLENTSVSVITKIGLDHTEVLGDTKEKIAGEKCGIIKNGAVVTSPYQEKEVLEVIRGRKVGVVIPDTKSLEIISSSISGNSFIYKGVNYKTKMAGEFQIENALVAIETLKLLDVKTEDIVKGIETAFIPARLQIIKQNPLVVVDGAHNPDGAAVLSRFLKDYKNATAVIGVMQDKDYKEVLKITLPLVKKVICITADNSERALKAEELALCAAEFCKDVTVCNGIEELENLLKKEKNETFIFGSLYLAVNVLKNIK